MRAGMILLPSSPYTRHSSSVVMLVCCACWNCNCPCRRLCPSAVLLQVLQCSVSHTHIQVGPGAHALLAGVPYMCQGGVSICTPKSRFETAIPLNCTSAQTPLFQQSLLTHTHPLHVPAHATIDHPYMLLQHDE